MKTMIGVMGSVAGYNEQASELAYRLGKAIAEHRCAIITGACPGLPHDAVRGARAAGGLTVGVSPGHNFAEHTIKYESPWKEYDVLIYTGSGLMGREITGVRSCDIVVLVGGRSGTLGEFAIAYDEGKLIGVLKDTGGIAEHVSMLVEVIQKDTGAQVIYDDDPDRLISTLVEVNAARRQTMSHDVFITPLLTANGNGSDERNNIEGVQQAIAAMEMEIQRLQASIAEQRQRLESYRDLATMGPAEKG
jgi:hypothetical protein